MFHDWGIPIAVLAVGIYIIAHQLRALTERVKLLEDKEK